MNPDHWLTPGVPLLLGVGTKAKQKGFDRFMPVFSALAQEVPSLHLALLGLSQGSYKGSYQQVWLRDKLGQDQDLQQRLLLPGMVGTMAAWYARATVFVLPSRFEGFPNVLLEAMAAGCVCVASDCLTGPAELIDHDVNGVLMAKDASCEDWIVAIKGLLQDRSRCKALGQEATKVRERFSPERLRHDFLEALRPLSHG